MDIKLYKFEKSTGAFYWSFEHVNDLCNTLVVAIYHPSITINKLETSFIGDSCKTLVNIEGNTIFNWRIDKYCDKDDGYSVTLKILGFGFGIYRQYGY